MTTGASARAFCAGFALYPFGPKNASTYDSSLIRAFTAGSVTTTNCQHWRFAQEGAMRAASSTDWSLSGSTGRMENLRTLRLVLIASSVSMVGLLAVGAKI